MVVEIIAYRLFQCQRAAMTAAFDLALGKQCEPALDLIQPGGRGRREMQTKARMAGKPRAHGRCLVWAVVVHRRVNRQVVEYIGLDGAQKLQKFLAAMPAMQLADHLASGDVECRKQGGCAMARVVMGASGRYARTQRQHRLGPVEGLNLALLVNAQHHGLERWMQIQANNVAHLVDEQRIGGELEGLFPMRLQTKGAPDAADGTLRKPQVRRQRSTAPVRGSVRPLRQRGRNQTLDLSITDLTRRAWPRLVQQPIEPLRDETTAPLADRLWRRANPLRDFAVRQFLRTRKDDARTKRQRLRGLVAARPFDQLLVLGLTQDQHWQSRSSSHVRLLGTHLNVRPRCEQNVQRIKDSIH